MKKMYGCAGAFALALCSHLALADDISVDVNSVGSGEIAFKAGQFTFTNNTSGPLKGYGFQLADTTGFTVPNGLDGLNGFITGTYTVVGPVATGATQADVTGTGTVMINDGLGTGASDYFTASVVWLDIMQAGAHGGLNNVPGLNLGLTNVSYGGSNVDLKELVSAIHSGGGVITLGWSFARPAPTLKQLASGTFTPTYAGQISSTIPEPGFYGVLCVGLVSLVALGKRMKARKTRVS